MSQSTSAVLPRLDDLERRLQQIELRSQPKGSCTTHPQQILSLRHKLEGKIQHLLDKYNQTQERLLHIQNKMENLIEKYDKKLASFEDQSSPTIGSQNRGIHLDLHDEDDETIPLLNLSEIIEREDKETQQLENEAERIKGEEERERKEEKERREEEERERREEEEREKERERLKQEAAEEAKEKEREREKDEEEERERKREEQEREKREKEEEELQAQIVRLEENRRREEAKEEAKRKEEAKKKEAKKEEQKKQQEQMRGREEKVKPCPGPALEKFPGKEFPFLEKNKEEMEKQHLERIAETNRVAQQQKREEEKQKDSPLEQLKKMGFTDEGKNIRLLRKHNNDLNAAVEELLFINY